MKRKRCELTETEKLHLIKEVKQHAAIWDVSNKNHCNASVLFAAWEEISEQMGKSMEECKTAWKSIKDSQRYQKKKKEKSGSSVEDVQETDLDSDIHETSQKDSFEASRVLLFMRPAREKRRTFTSTSNCGENVREGGQGSSSRPHAFDNTRKKSHMAACANSLAQSVKEFIEKTTAVPEQQFKNYAMLANLDNMLKDLPNDVIHELNVAFVSMTYEKIKEFKNKN